MKIRRSHHLRTLAVALATALLPTVSMAATVALRATIEFNEQTVPMGPPCFLTGTISGNSTASSVGPIRLASSDCINPLSATTFLFVSDQVVLTMNSGEQIFAAYGGTLSATTGAIRGAYFIYGGTGRFQNASGVGKISGFENVNTTTGMGAGKIDLNGTLSY
jgi:hypothetical protein